MLRAARRRVDLIIVRSDDSHVQYDDSDIAADEKITQPLMFPAPGRYRIVTSAYLPVSSPQTQNNFQLFTTVHVRGSYRPQTIPPFSATQVIDGYRFQIQGSLDYVDTHVCSPGAIYCASALGATKVTGNANAPGRLTVGVRSPSPVTGECS